PELIDDFVRNFFVKMGLTRTLDCFQTEWYELMQKGQLNPEDVSVVPDIYTKNDLLDQDIKVLHGEVEKFKTAAQNAKQTYIRLRKERDYHRMHHQRVAQEKNKLISDLKKLKKHYAQYEPTLTQLRQKYETAMREKMLTRLERDRVVNQVPNLIILALQQQMATIPPLTATSAATDLPGKAYPLSSQKSLASHATGENRSNEAVVQRSPDSEFPPDTGINPYLTMQKSPCIHLTRAGGLRLSNTIEAHDMAVSGIAIHPRKKIVATVSDDNKWKMWAIPSGEAVMTGEGHTDWISDCCFHPDGTKLATASGDTTVKIWDFSKAKCTQTFSDHSHAVWGVSWHTCGDFIASCSLDHTAKIWDLNSIRCRTTLRGHTDSVNSVSFLPFSNTLVSSSADKTVSLWDARTGLCVQTFYGHMHSCNDAVFNLKGDTIASCDAYGIVKFWNIATSSMQLSVDVGPHSANKIAFDPTGVLLAVASNDGSIKMVEVNTGKVTTLNGHEDAVQTVAFDQSGEYLLSGGSDATIRIWS
ncbi:uncharacterized protein TRIADDRAFT_31080, partial [Trichoplax adhaerens]